MDREEETMAERQRTTTDPTLSERDPYGQPRRFDLPDGVELPDRHRRRR